MTTPTIFAVPESAIGLAFETARGTPVAPVYWVGTKAPKYKPDLQLLEDNSLKGSFVDVYNLVPGLRYDGHGWDGYPYLDTFAVFLRALLGSPDTLTAAPTNTTLAAAAAAGATSVTFTATIATDDWVVIGAGMTQETHKVATGGTTATLAAPLAFAQPSGATVAGLTGHTFSLLNQGPSDNQPPSMTITDYDGEEWRQLPAAQLDKLTLKGNATGLVDYTCSWFANASETPSSPTEAFTSVQPVPGWTLQVSIGGTPIPYMVDWEFDLSRNVKPVPALTGTEAYYTFFAGPLSAAGKLTVIEQTGAPELSQYLSATQQAFDFTLFDRGTGFAMNLHSTLAEFKTGEVDRGKEWVEAMLDFQLLPSSTDATAGGVSQMITTVANAKTTTY